MAEPAIKRLGTFLADLTHDKPADQIHAEILQRLRDPGMDLDHRLAGIYLHVKDFVPIWTAIRNGVTLPQTSWETVVLPAVVHFSPPQSVKANLEAATNLWLTARGSRVLDPTPEPAPPPLVEPEEEAPRPALLEQFLEPAPPAVTRPGHTRGRRWVPQTAAVALIAVAGWLVWSGSPGDHALVTDLPRLPMVTSPGSPAASPSADASAVPSEIPSASPTAGAATTSNAPRPTPTRPGQTTKPPPPGPQAPGIPTGLTAVMVETESVTLSWQPSGDPAVVAQYKIFQDGTIVGPAFGTSERIVSLKPATTYKFTVVAVGKDGRESAQSAPLSVRTLDPPAELHAPKDVYFGEDIALSGTGWQCSDVQLFIDSQHVATVSTSSGYFSASISVHEVDGNDGYVDIVGTSEYLVLTSGSWHATTKCAGGAIRTAGFNVVV